MPSRAQLGHLASIEPLPPGSALSRCSREGSPGVLGAPGWPSLKGKQLAGHSPTDLRAGRWGEGVASEVTLMTPPSLLWICPLTE